jgi:hypothetical protein
MPIMAYMYRMLSLLGHGMTIYEYYLLRHDIVRYVPAFRSLSAFLHQFRGLFIPLVILFAFFRVGIVREGPNVRIGIDFDPQKCN